MTSDDHVICPHCNGYFRISTAKVLEVIKRLKSLVPKAAEKEQHDG